MKKFILVFCAVVLTGTAYAQDTTKMVSPQNKTLATLNGRFIFGQVSDFRSDQYMLDTQTGRLWQLVERTDDKGNTIGRALQIVPFASGEGKLGLVPN